MVRYLYIFLISLFLFPAFLNAQELSFDAYIDRENVSVGETFQIKLELINAQAEAAPDLSVLPPEVTVTSQQQQVSSTFINGVRSQNVAWILDVVVEKEGTYKIPAIEARTNAGPLYTKPFRIFVKPASQLSSNTSDNSVFIDVQIENQTPYIDEPVLYKTVVYHLNEIANAELVKPKAENAIVEQISEPNPSRQILNGINYKVIQVEYLVTPLKTGEVVIEPSILRGKIARDFGNVGATPMDNLFAPFGGAAMPTKEYVPFTVASNKVKITVKPAEAAVNPWLALYDLQIDDELGDVNFDQKTNRINAKAGEPITRKVRLTAYGKSGESLPELENLFNSPDFKVYSDKAENNKEFVDGAGPVTSRIKGTKTQTFTFIPQKTGMLNLPELNITYWSLKDNKVAKANLPGKVITVSEGEKVDNGNNVDKIKDEPKPQQAAQTEAAQEPKEVNVQQKIDEIMNSPQAPNLILLVLSFVICVIMFVSFKILTSAKRNKEVFDEELINPKKKETFGGRKIIDETQMIIPSRNKKNNLVNIDSNKKSENIESGFSGRINSADSYQEIQELLQKFAARYLGISQNSATIIIAQALARKFGVDRALAMKYAAELDSVLYAGRSIELDYFRSAFSGLIAQAEAKLNSSSDKDDDDDLIALNP